MYCIHCGASNEDDYEFCIKCGASLKDIVQEPNQTPISSPEPPQMPTQEPVNAVPGPSVRPQPEKKKTNLKLDQKVLLPLFAMGGGLLLLLLIGLTVALNLERIGAWFYNTFGPGDVLYYTVQEQGVSSPIIAINSIRTNEKTTNEVYSDPDGFQLAQSYTDIYSRWYSYLSPDGNTVALIGTKDQTLYLLPLKGGSPTTVDKVQNNQAAILPIGFSKDGKLYAYSNYQYNGTVQKGTISVIDLQGNEVSTIPDYMYGIFLNNNRQMAVFNAQLKSNSSTYTANLSLINVKNGDVETPLVDYDLNINGISAPGLMFQSSSGNDLYYSDNEGLNKVSIRGGSSKQVIDTKGMPFGFETGNGNYLVVIDVDTTSSPAAGDLYVLNLRNNKKTRIDKFLSLQPSIIDPYSHEIVQMSPDSRTLAYVTTDSSGGAEMNLTKITGEGTTMVAHGGAKYRYAFTPDGKHFVYLESYSDNDVGTLYVTDASRQRRVRLDDYVWSFRLVNGGSQIVYSRVEDLSRGRPSSEIVKIGIDGKVKKVLIPSDDGLFTFLPAAH
jgi:hypothetical protein